MPDLGIFGWIIVGLLAGAIAGAFVPGDRRQGCLGTLLIGVDDAVNRAILAALPGEPPPSPTPRPSRSPRSPRR